MPTLRIVGYESNLQKIHSIQVLRFHLIKDLKSAMECVEEITAGKEFEFEVETDEYAIEIANDLRKFGLVVVLELDKHLN